MTNTALYFAQPGVNAEEVSEVSLPIYPVDGLAMKEAGKYTLEIEKYFLGDLPLRKRRRRPRRSSAPQTRSSRRELGKRDIDLIIASRHRFRGEEGDRAFVDKIHLMEENFEPAHPEGLVEFDTIWATKDYRESKFKQADIELFLVDKNGMDKDEKNGVKKLIATVASIAGAVFPVFAPFAGIASGAASKIVDFIDDLQDDEILFDASFSLVGNPEPYPHGRPGRSEPVLQRGLYLLVDGIPRGGHQDYALGYDQVLMQKINGSWAPAAGLNYIVLRLVNRYTPSNDFEMGESAATLFSELNRAPDQSQPVNVMNFITDTFKFYEGFKKIDRYHDLSKKAALTEDEKTRLEELKKDPQILKYVQA